MFNDVIFDFEACAKNFFLYKISSTSNDDSKNSSSLPFNFGYNVNDEYISSHINRNNNLINSQTKLRNNNNKIKRVKQELQSNKEEKQKFKNDDKFEEFEKCNFFVSFSVYFTWFVLTVFAYIREFLRYYGFEKNKSACERLEMRDFAPLFNSFEAIYARNCYMRVRDVFERPICGVPGGTVKLLDRETDDYFINTASYNYLGFAENKGPCATASANIINDQGISSCASIRELGQPLAHTELENLVAEFIGVESAICFGMGFATNSMNLTCLMDKDSLIISDQYNHASLILGSKISGATIKIFKHNNIKDLERVLRQSIIFGNSKKEGKPFSKIMVIIEGIYSMEGTICKLDEIIKLKKKYKFYLYLDEAHSIGAMGKTGRGIVEYYNCDSKDVDIFMGTFTKSFGAAGGYIAGSKALISHIRQNSPGEFYTIPMSPPIAKQIFTAMSSIMGKDGTGEGQKRIEQLAKNTNYVRLKLKQLGFIVYGSNHSPVIPIMIYHPTKCGLWGRLMLERKIGVVVVSFPATEMTQSRVRICISAAHTKEMLDKLLKNIDEVGDISRTKHSNKSEFYKSIEAIW
uniref:serine C-palmitoyltransferase n=1 Tax=Meloidogyne floridensis TaxID=298350 RepID=A0A915PF00_9BILA